MASRVVLERIALVIKLLYRYSYSVITSHVVPGDLSNCLARQSRIKNVADAAKVLVIFETASVE